MCDLKLKCNLCRYSAVVHLPGMFEELDTLDKAGVKVDNTRLVVSDRAHMLFDLHKVGGCTRCLRVSTFNNVFSVYVCLQVEFS